MARLAQQHGIEYMRDIQSKFYPAMLVRKMTLPEYADMVIGVIENPTTLSVPNVFSRDVRLFLLFHNELNALVDLKLLMHFNVSMKIQVSDLWFDQQTTKVGQRVRIDKDIWITSPANLETMRHTRLQSSTLRQFFWKRLTNYLKAQIQASVLASFANETLILSGVPTHHNMFDPFGGGASQQPTKRTKLCQRMQNLINKVCRLCQINVHIFDQLP